MRNTEGRYKISRLNKRSIKCRTVQQRDTFSVEMLQAYPRGPVHRSEFQFTELGYTKEAGGSTPSFLKSSLFFLFFPSFLNILPSNDRGVVVVLLPGDSSSSWTNHLTAVVCLPSWC
ncbi:hypothetical protein AVEN_94824-1 [Araneus ventricosus]|uniref:Uncharacterized protein n=1 Tax=Araneus ventricosus TaxID=182803 RepID=A0A4Y2CPB6_ARAVE|nr:hypothetical protein AVEN_94824-1 [Araneus ventricosus]